MEYEILDSMSRADIAYRVRGNDPVELFMNGAHALTAIMLEDIGAIRPAESITFSIAAPGLDLLYYDYLTEFIFYKDSQKLVLLPVTVAITESGEGYALSCTATGEQIDRQRHRFKTDIKAITLHNLNVVQTCGEWQATIVVDV